MSLLARLGRGLRDSREPILIFLVTRGALFLLAYLSLAVLPLNPDPSSPSSSPAKVMNNTERFGR